MLVEAYYQFPNFNNVKEPKLDYNKARKWDMERSRQLHIQITEFSGIMNGNITAGTINGGTFITGLPKETMSKRINREKVYTRIF